MKKHVIALTAFIVLTAIATTPTQSKAATAIANPAMSQVNCCGIPCPGSPLCP